jgi:protease-4
MSKSLAAGLSLFFSCLTLAGCSPASFNVSVGPGSRTLRESMVLSDKGAGSNKVAMIDLRGVIADQSEPGFFGAAPNPVDEFLARLRMAENDASVKALIIRVNSPGGSVTASDILYREVRRFRETTGKPVIASMGEIAASGGYYISLAADEILAEPTSLTGSIGVIIPTINFSDGLSRIGIVSRSVMSGPNKDLGNPLEPMRDAQYAVLQDVVDEFYAKFTGLVRERRPGLDAAHFDEATDGRIVTGATAVAWGMIDREGGVREAFDLAKERAGVAGASLVKYSVSTGKNRTAYSESAVETSRAEGTDINLVQLRLSGLQAGGNAYYLWGLGAP